MSATAHEQAISPIRQSKLATQLANISLSERLELAKNITDKPKEAKELVRDFLVQKGHSADVSLKKAGLLLFHSDRTARFSLDSKQEELLRDAFAISQGEKVSTVIQPQPINLSKEDLSKLAGMIVNGEVPVDALKNLDAMVRAGQFPRNLYFSLLQEVQRKILENAIAVELERMAREIRRKDLENTRAALIKRILRNLEEQRVEKLARAIREILK